MFKKKVSDKSAAAANADVCKKSENTNKTSSSSSTGVPTPNYYSIFAPAGREVCGLRWNNVYSAQRVFEASFLLGLGRPDGIDQAPGGFCIWSHPLGSSVEKGGIESWKIVDMPYDSSMKIEDKKSMSNYYYPSTTISIYYGPLSDQDMFNILSLSKSLSYNRIYQILSATSYSSQACFAILSVALELLTGKQDFSSAKVQLDRRTQEANRQLQFQEMRLATLMPSWKTSQTKEKGKDKFPIKPGDYQHSMGGTLINRDSVILTSRRSLDREVPRLFSPIEESQQKRKGLFQRDNRNRSFEDNLFIQDDWQDYD